MYLITGGAGFIGSNFIRFLLSKEEDVLVINYDKLTYAGNLENLRDYEGDERLIFIRGDICDKEKLEEIFANYDIRFVVNFAAESHVDRSILDPEVFVKTNVLGAVTLLNVAKKHWEKNGFKNRRFVQISTDEVYGELPLERLDLKFTEETPLFPRNPYSSSKASADLIVMSYCKTYDMPVNITRCSNNYGPYQFPEKLIPLVITNCMNKKPIPVYGDGRHVRDWIYVEDHCEAVYMVIKGGRPGHVYNIGGDNERHNIDVVKIIINIMRDMYDPSISEELVLFVEDRRGHDRRYAINSGKIQRELGWRPRTDFETGIRKTIEWYIKNKEWVKNVISGEYQRYYELNYGRRKVLG